MKLCPGCSLPIQPIFRPKLKSFRTIDLDKRLHDAEQVYHCHLCDWTEISDIERVPYESND